MPRRSLTSTLIDRLKKLPKILFYETNYIFFNYSVILICIVVALGLLYRSEIPYQALHSDKATMAMLVGSAISVLGGFSFFTTTDVVTGHDHIARILGKKDDDYHSHNKQPSEFLSFCKRVLPIPLAFPITIGFAKALDVPAADISRIIATLGFGMLTVLPGTLVVTVAGYETYKFVDDYRTKRRRKNDPSVFSAESLANAVVVRSQMIGARTEGRLEANAIRGFFQKMDLNLRILFYQIIHSEALPGWGPQRPLILGPAVPPVPAQIHLGETLVTHLPGPHVTSPIVAFGYGAPAPREIEMMPLPETARTAATFYPARPFG